MERNPSADRVIFVTNKGLGPTVTRSCPDVDVGAVCVLATDGANTADFREVWICRGHFVRGRDTGVIDLRPGYHRGIARLKKSDPSASNSETLGSDCARGGT